jgi:nitrate/TMAO reductase-like tetraheme cytochrome c subunit
MMVENKMHHSVFTLLLLFFFLTMINIESSKAIAQETDPKAFKILKEKSIDPQTGLPKTLDPKLFKGKANRAYQVAREIPEILTQIPCFCECEPFGHENLLDCFIDNHGAG